MKKTYIHYNPNGDARTLDHIPYYDELLDAVETHRDNMKTVLTSFEESTKERAESHDHSVLDYFDDYYVATVAHLNDELPFSESLWYKEHFEDEPYRRCRSHTDTANLFDLIEAVCDHVVTHNEKGADPRKHLSKEQVYQIYINTIRQLEDSIETML